MQSFGIALSAWREILARIFEGFQRQDNASPPWLVNPATKRRLKLDMYYPEIGFAVRFIGLTAKGQGRQSDWEVLEEEQRDQTRAELCRQNQVQLLLIEPLEDPIKLMDTLARLLLRSFRAMDQRDLPEADRQRGLRRIDAARSRAGELRSLINREPEQMMTNLAASGRDREAGLLNTISQTEAAASPPVLAGPPIQFEVGQRVAHERFGEGVVTACSPEGEPEEEDMRVTILFDADQERTFLASIVQGKLRSVA
ncbi:MAG: hypothetical protein WDZ49_06705 [Litorilinea sp.]